MIGLPSIPENRREILEILAIGKCDVNASDDKPNPSRNLNVELCFKKQKGPSPEKVVTAPPGCQLKREKSPQGEKAIPRLIPELWIPVLDSSTSALL